jgi:cyclopropane fatty-acyl-phospholipid synthase-like methyltransferase
MSADANTDPIPGWLLNEVASAGRENLDPAHVARYDDKEDADAEEEVRICEALGLSASSTVVEFGSGTGQFTIAAASRCARVVAVDVSEMMHRRLSAKLESIHLDNVELVQAGFLTYRHVGAAVDFVYSRYALHHLPDFWKAVALERIHAILRPGGIFRLWDVVFNFQPSEAAERLERWCATGGSAVDDEWSRAELEEHVRDEHSTFTWIVEPMAARCGFSVQSADYSDDGIVAKYVLRRS